MRWSCGHNKAKDGAMKEVEDWNKELAGVYILA